jgi:hypothetical protein
MLFIIYYVLYKMFILLGWLLLAGEEEQLIMICEFPYQNLGMMGVGIRNSEREMGACICLLLMGRSYPA